MSKETCPFCGNEYERLSVHLLYCKEKPVEDETVSYDEIYIVPEDDTPVDITTSYTEEESQWVTLEEVKPVLSPIYTKNLPPIPFNTPLTEPEPVTEPTQSIPCPYLVVIAGSGCSSCKGTTCMASKDKKISNDDYCRYEWQDCILYEESTAAGVPSSCPYISLTVPEGRYSCTGMWCYARNKAVKVSKRCRNWSACGPFLEAKSDGKPFYRKAVK